MRERSEKCPKPAQSKKICPRRKERKPTPQVPPKAQKSLSYRNQALHNELRLALRRIQMRIRNEPKAISQIPSRPWVVLGVLILRPLLTRRHVLRA